MSKVFRQIRGLTLTLLTGEMNVKAPLQTLVEVATLASSVKASAATQYTEYSRLQCVVGVVAAAELQTTHDMFSTTRYA